MTDNIIEVTDNSFEQEVLQSNLPVLVDFYAPWCRPCLAIAPVVDELADDYESKLKVVRCNLEDNPGLHRDYGIRGIPTLLFFRCGDVNGRITGNVAKSQISEAIEKMMD